MANPTANTGFVGQHNSSGDSPDDPNVFTLAEMQAAMGTDSTAISLITSGVASRAASGALDSIPVSTADSKGVSSGTRASVADSKAISDSSNISLVDSKASSNSVNTSIADSKAVSVATATPVVTAIVYSANISTADSKATSIAIGVPAESRTTTNVGTFVSNNAEYNPLDYSSGVVINTGINNAATAIGLAIAAAVEGFTTFAKGTYLVSALTALKNSKIRGRGALLKPSGPNMTVLQLSQGIGPGNVDFCAIEDLRIDGTTYTGITGVKAIIAAGQYLASVKMKNVVAYNCDTVGFDFQNAQFIESEGLVASGGTGTGMLIKNVAADGGGNSHLHKFPILYNKEVGLFVNGQGFATGCLSLHFQNPQILLNSVCGAALFSCKAVFDGGAPELNGTGSATKTVDGLTVKRSSMYLNAADVRVNDCTQGETGTCDPQYLIENGSTLTLRNCGFNGHSSSTSLHVSADSTSRVILEGTFAGQSTTQNVMGWPDALYLPPTAQVCLFGKPVHRVDTSLQGVFFGEQATAWASVATSAPTSNAFAEDADLGYCRSVTFQAVAGDGPTQVGCVKTTISAVPASKDSAFSWLWKSDKDCTMFVEMHDGASFNAVVVSTIKLYANKVTKVFIGKRNIPAGNWLFTWGPFDTSAPNVKMSNFQLYQGATGTIGTTMDIAKIVSSGAFWPGVTREIQANLRLLTASVNTMGKYPGKQVWDTTNNRFVVAAGQAAADVWKDGVTSTVHTPV